MKKTFVPILAIAFPLFYTAPIQAETNEKTSIVEQTMSIQSICQLNPTTIEIWYVNNQHATIDFYGENIFRVFQDNAGGIIRDPKAMPEAQILVDNPRHPVSKLAIEENGNTVSIHTQSIQIELNKQTSLMKVTNLQNGKVAFEEITPALFGKNKVTLTLKEQANEYFYGGGRAKRTFFAQRESHCHRKPKQLDRWRCSFTDPILLVNPRLWHDVAYVQER